MQRERNNIAVDEWKIIEKEFSIENNIVNETLFTVANGYIGLRGSFEEGLDRKNSIEGTFINGFYETHEIKYGEKAYAFPEIGQTMLNVFNPKVIKIKIDDEEFNMLDSNILEYERILDLKEAVLKRRVVWKTKSGKEIELNFERFASFKIKNVALVKLKIKPLNFDGNINIYSYMNLDVKNLTAEDDPRVGSGIIGRAFNIDKRFIDEKGYEVYSTTKKSKLKLICSVTEKLNEDIKYNRQYLDEEYKLGFIYDVEGKKEKEIELTKYIVFVNSREYEENRLGEIKDNIKSEVLELGYEELKMVQKRYMEDFWYRADVEIEGDELLQQGIRFNMFHILQSTGKDGITNIGAKGLTGEGYEGHYFWDTEMYIVPLFTYTMPYVARKLLEYRYNTLDKARERARELSHKKGALYAWRTINGEECSAYFLASTAQYHINADIAFAIKRYFEATGDVEFMLNCGAEILFETARVFVDLGHYVEGKGFCLDGVTGPDEYTAMVNNNAYTNIMAKEHLNFAYEVAQMLKNKYEERFDDLKRKIYLEDNEVDEWKKAADSMYIPYDENLKIHPQDDTFLSKKVWDFENTPKDKYPLLLHYHPLVIYRHQVCKQADWVLALFLHSEKFSKEQKKRDYDYYEKVTTHDSSLSPCIFSIVACDIGYKDKAYDYFMRTARMDLDDHHGNTKDGIHAANMAGSWMGIVFGFGGFRVYNDRVNFNPIIPDKWRKYSFRVNYKGRLIKVVVEKNSVKVHLLEGEEIKVDVYNNTVLLSKDRDVEVSVVVI
ncbi:MAG: glycoside hydrolase family 65 protein [Caloramator sp.]|nr:glycoside hydrolase family 65 protein [Caloramator sp.]